MLGRLAAALALLALPAGPGAAETARLLGRATVTVPSAYARAFGGISGIDRDPRSGRWLLVSDDRSERAPSRFYVARIRVARDGTPRARIRARRDLRDTAGLLFPTTGAGVADAEAIRVTPDGKRLVWASEGNAIAPTPIVRIATRDGREAGRVSLPAVFTDARANLGIEGLAYTREGALWLAMEAPLVTDGAPAGPDRPALVRVTRIDRTGAVHQYAYQVDAVPGARPGDVADNGVSEVLALDDSRLLVLERSGRRRADGHFAYHCRLYIADPAQADDVGRVASLTATAARPMQKTLLFDFDTVTGRAVANLEGMAWADGGQRRLVLINDDNFDPEQPTEMVVLGIDP
jgi:hypothetical protein